MRPKKLLLDTNVVVDFIGKRDPFYENARLLMICGRVGEYNLWISSSQVTDLVFILTHGGNKKYVPEVLQKLRTMRLFINVYPVTDLDTDKMLATTWHDPEDALLVYLAMKMHDDAIITRDAEFPHPEGIPVKDCNEFFEWVRDDFGLSYEDLPI
jgi:predicted nucleic acid-binding protein